MGEELHRIILPDKAPLSSLVQHHLEMIAVPGLIDC